MRTLSLAALSLACLAAAATVALAAEEPAVSTDTAAAEAQPAVPIVVALGPSAGSSGSATRKHGGQKGARMPVHYLTNRDNYWGNSFGLASGSVDLDYGHIMPSPGNDSDYFGFNSNALLKLDTNFGVNLNLGYHNASGTGSSTDNVLVGGTGLWFGDGWRGGPSFSYQNNSVGGFSTNTYTYGGYFDYFPTDRLTLSGKAGGFSWNPGDSGYYIGGQAEWYPTRHIGLGLSVDHADYDIFNTTNLSLFAEKKLPIFCAPTILQLGYTHVWEAPGSFGSDSIWMHLQFVTSGNGSRSLIDIERTGTLSSFSQFTPYR